MQNWEATEHVFSHLKNTLWVFSLAALLLWSLNLWRLQESVSCGIHDLQLCLQEPCSDGELLLCGILVPASFFFFLHSLCKHTEVRFCVLWHNSIYSPTVTWHPLYYSLFAIWANCNIKKQSIWCSFARPDRKWFSNKPQLPLNTWKPCFTNLQWISLSVHFYYHFNTLRRTSSSGFRNLSS